MSSKTTVHCDHCGKDISDPKYPEITLSLHIHFTRPDNALLYVTHNIPSQLDFCSPQCMVEYFKVRKLIVTDVEKLST